jgi:hypothetical protein
MNLDEPVWDVTVFTENRDRLLDGDVAREFLSEVVKQAQAKDLTSDEHFTRPARERLQQGPKGCRFESYLRSQTFQTFTSLTVLRKHRQLRR